MRATSLHPFPEVAHDCPHCCRPLEIFGWRIPGMRNLADLRCPVCGREFYGDLAAGQALYTPMLLDKESGTVHDKHGVPWFAEWLHDSYAQRTEVPLPFEIEKRAPITRHVVLLNCLDTLYGHSLLKLLNAQYYLEQDVDLILIIPPFLSWMVPAGVAEVWHVGLPLKRGREWNDWLDREIHRRVESLEAVSLSYALSHPSPADYNIERFTGVQPFPLEQWQTRLERPTVTFIWRDDRIWWAPDRPSSLVRAKLQGWTRRRHRSQLAQSRMVVALAEALRSEWSTLDFAITGLSEVEKNVDVPSWFIDLRRPTMDESHERLCCERYASSHVVVGVHGSNMLLPTAHAGGLVELIGPERWGNFTQDVLFREAGDCRETLFRYRFLPRSTPPLQVASMVTLLLRGREPFRGLINRGRLGSIKG